MTKPRSRGGAGRGRQPRGEGLVEVRARVPAWVRDALDELAEADRVSMSSVIARLLVRAMRERSEGR